MCGYSSTIGLQIFFQLCISLCLQKKLLETKGSFETRALCFTSAAFFVFQCPNLGLFLFTSTNGVQDERRIQGPQGHLSDLWYVINISMCGFFTWFHTGIKNMEGFVTILRKA
jgi:hypothetical protein